MASTKVTYVGGDNTGGAKSTIWKGIAFPLGQAVAVTDPEIIRKAKGHPHFTVEEIADDLPTKPHGKGKKIAESAGEDAA